MLVFALIGNSESASDCQNNVSLGTTVPEGAERHLPGIVWGCTGSLGMPGCEEMKSPTSSQGTVLFRSTLKHNKVRELATVCLPWQHWTKALVWFDEVDISDFTAVFLLIYGSLFLSGIHYCLRVFWCATARMSELELEQRTNIKFLVVSW